MSAAPDDTVEPTSFGGYRLRSVVADDLTTTTYRATVEDRGVDVALRVVDDTVAAHARAVKGFLHVNQRIAAIGHPHLLSVVDQGTHAGTAYVATSWRDGLLFGDLLLATAPLDVADALRLGGHLAEALDTVHARGVVHGMVGLPTVWVRRREGSRAAPSAALTAFGTSHLIAPVLHRVEDDEAAAELLFVAPEQLRGQPAGPAADQYALGCLLFTAITGTTPFRGDTNNDLFGAHLYGEVPSASAVRPDLDPRWDEVFARALHKEPDERYENCRTLLLAAGRAGRHRRATSTPTASPRAASDVTLSVDVDDVAPFEDAPRRTVRTVLVALLALALLLLAALTTGVLDATGAEPDAVEQGAAGAQQDAVEQGAAGGQADAGEQGAASGQADAGGQGAAQPETPPED